MCHGQNLFPEVWFSKNNTPFAKIPDGLFPKTAQYQNQSLVWQRHAVKWPVEPSVTHSIRALIILTLF